MSLYAIGDLHLHFQSELKARNQIEDKVWKNHEEIFLENCRSVVKDEDTLVLVGDHSWGKNMDQCRQDLEYIENLPGRKILLRGNHDMFWDAKKTAKLNEGFAGRLNFLQNNYFAYEDYALVGTKGYTFEGPFYLDRYGNVQGWDEKEAEHAEKLVARESERLIASFEAAKSDGYKKFIMFLHYPPTNILQTNSIFTKLAEQYGVEQVVYGHCHGESRFHDSIIGKKRRIRYSLVSGDFLRWHPMQILK
ncbi:MAG: metallophosphoesterase [Pseudobutyrivibrio sp.]|nr:metallophosphoesterase [Pseudobutyrivibrio sp.]